MPPLFRFAAISAAFLLGPLPRGLPAPEGGVERWGLYEVELHGPAAGNPFTDVIVGARFSHASLDIQVPGFYDGNGAYRIRFMPPEDGDWGYSTASNIPSLNGKTGRFQVHRPSPGNHGPVRVAHGTHFAYADGTPYWELGTTCYSWAFAGDASEAETLRTLSASPFNKLRMCLLPQDFMPEERFPYEGSPPRAWDTSRFNPAFFRHLEARIADLQRLGIEADLILFHPYDHRWHFSDLSPAEDERYVRYAVARFAAYRNVWWSLANEYDFIRSKRLPEWDHLFETVAGADPYGHLRSIHNGSLLYDYTHPWATHASIQNGSAVEEPGRAEEYRDVYLKPIVFDEVKYEGDIARRWGALGAEELVLRFWNGTVAGTYVGHSECFVRSSYSYRGVALHDAEASWLGVGGRLVGRSEARLAFLRNVLEAAPSEGIDPIDKWQDARTGGQPGKYYLVYFGRSTPASWPFSLYKAGLSAGMRFRAEILDTWNMTVTPVPGDFTIVPQGDYNYADRDGRSIALPALPYIALRIQRSDSP